MKKVISTLLTLSIILVSIVIIKWTVSADTSPNPDIDEEKQGEFIKTHEDKQYCLSFCQTREITVCNVSVDDDCVLVYTDSQGNTCYVNE